MNAARRRKAENRRQAVALQYSSAEDLPRVLTSGSGHLAEHILELAKQHNIPVHENTTLAEILACLPQGTSIPPETFRLVAEVVCFLYHVDEQWRKEHGFLERVAGEVLTKGQSDGISTPS